jgi:hypothetical protein
MRMRPKYHTYYNGKSKIYSSWNKCSDQDVLVPWKLRGGNEPKNPSEDDGREERIFQRYYHVFEEGELEGLVEQVEGLQVRLH